jgi:hypothetical protein
MSAMPEHLRGLSGDELWAQYRANGCDIFAPWPDEDDLYLGPTLLEAAEILYEIEESGGAIEINLDVFLPDDAPPLLADDWDWIHEHGDMIKGLLRFQREAEYNLRSASESPSP